MIVLDTNVLSEMMRGDPAQSVVRWLDAQPRSRLYTTSITQAEILYGICRLPAGKRRTALSEAADAMFDEDFAGRVLPFGHEAARFFAEITADRYRRGTPIAQSDAQIAAIARMTGASIATRNTADFEGCDVAVVNPWAVG